MAILHNNVVPFVGGEYTIDQSLRFEDGSSAYLSRTPASAGNRKTWTFSAWIKLGSLSQGERGTIFQSNSGGPTIYQDSGLRFAHAWDPAGTDYIRETVAVFRDPSAWYHVVWWCDTTQAGTRWKIYVNGTEQSLQTPSGYNGEPAQNTDLNINSTNLHTIGVFAAYSYLDGYLSEVHFIDGQALTPDYFGEVDDTYGHWKPIAYTGTYGTNGFYLPFSGTFYNDASGNGNNWTANNLATTDVVLDSPTNNFCTWNAVDHSTGNAVTSEGNLKFSVSSAGQSGIRGNFLIPRSGKWYWEAYLLTNSGGSPAFGVCNTKVFGVDYADADGLFCFRPVGGDSFRPYFVIDSSDPYGSAISSSALGAGDIVQILWDVDNGYGYIGINNTFYGLNGTTPISVNASQIAAGTYAAYSVPSDEDWVPYIHGYNATDFAVANFGQDSSFAGNKTAQNNTDANGYGDFYYSPPSGFLALCTANLSDPAVVPVENFNTVLYTGNGTSQSITVGFQPDWLWLKCRNVSGTNHRVVDVVRGLPNVLKPNETAAENTDVDVSAFISNGFSVSGSGSGEGNHSGENYVAWNWKADNTSGSSNTDGSITSTVAANVDAGFSIVSYTGTGSSGTIGHGLSSAPELVIYKNRSSALAWFVQGGPSVFSTVSPAYNYRLLLNDTGAIAYDTGHFTANPTSSVLSVGSYGYTNQSGSNHIAYCFHSVDGYSKFGSYTGNGSSDGPFIYTGFRPKWIMFKNTALAEPWVIRDTSRDLYNPSKLTLLADSSNAEFSWNDLDILSNGFKIKAGATEFNYNGSNIIYMAFAEYDFKHSNGR